MKPSLKMSLLPMTSTDDSEKNLQKILECMEGLPEGTDILCAPENSLYFNLGDDPIGLENAFTKESPELKKLGEVCSEKELHLHLGGIPWNLEGKVYNEAVLIDDQGIVHTSYEKIHMFDVDLAPGVEIRESNSFKAGWRLQTFTIKDWKVATCICYDLRFAELFLHYVQKEGVDLFLVPSAFTAQTGKAHWEILNRARAIETQCFVAAPAQVGFHNDPQGHHRRKTWGQSLVISPWGEVLASSGNFGEFLDSSDPKHEPINCKLDYELVLKARKAIPMDQHRVFDISLEKK